MNAEQQNGMSPHEMSRRYMENIHKNFCKLVEATKISQNALSKKLNEKGVSVNQGTISKYLKGTLEMQLSVIVKLCEIFSISILDFVSEDFKYLGDEISTRPVDTQHLNPGDAALYIPKLGDKFITNPDDLAFQGYMQDYFCYFFPTLSGENRLLTGTLTLKKRDSICEAVFKLKTNRARDGEPIFKNYSGCAVISTSVSACYVILSSPEEGEICIINFRHLFIRHESLECRVAEVVTNGAGEGHPPTVHRMLLSRSKIEDEHLPLITPHLHLNRSEIQIRKDELNELRDEAAEYNELIEQLLNAAKPLEIYSLKENYVRSNAERFLAKQEVWVFLSKLRARASKVRYNKVSKRADESVRNMLLALGYYQENRM